MSLAAIRARLKTIVETADTVSAVYDRERWAADWDTFLDRFKITVGEQDYIRGWMVSCLGFTQERLAFPNADGTISKLRTYTFKVRGVFGVDDSASTELTYANLAVTVLEAIDADATLHNQSVYYDCPPVDLTIYDYRMFGGVLCHYTEITVTPVEYVET